MRLIELDEPRSGERDNVTDWCLGQFQSRYGPGVSKDDIWEYMYGVMHAPDWRERYRFDLERSLPRIPLADDFEAFRAAGRELMDLHAGYESCEEYSIRAVVSTERERERERERDAVWWVSRPKPSNTRSRDGALSTGRSIPSGARRTRSLASSMIPTVGMSGLIDPST